VEIKNRPYIGITGFTEKEQVTQALDSLPSTDRKLMVGVVATYKSLRGIPMNPYWQASTPYPTSIKELFLPDDRTLNLVHYSTELNRQYSLFGDMIRVRDQIAGRHNHMFHGFQINMTWPNPDQIEEYRRYVGDSHDEIILQINGEALEVVDNRPNLAMGIINQYVGLVDRVLFDLSGGRGIPIDIKQARQYLRPIADKGWDLGLGVAGGLCAESLDTIIPLLEEFPGISFDATGKLLGPDGRLDSNLFSQYLVEGVKLVNQHTKR
jgi:hypothetical protein